MQSLSKFQKLCLLVVVIVVSVDMVQEFVLPHLLDNKPSLGLSAISFWGRFNRVGPEAASLEKLDRLPGGFQCKILPAPLADGSSIITIVGKTDSKDQVHSLTATLAKDKLKGNDDKTKEHCLWQWLDVVLFLTTTVQPGNTKFDAKQFTDSLGVLSSSEKTELTRTVAIADIEYKLHSTQTASELTITPIEGVAALPNTTEVFEKRLKSLEADKPGLK